MRIQIDNSCPEIWDNMKDIDEGKFCDKCAKSVIDFSNADDYEIENYITYSKEPVCGKIFPDKNLIKSLLTASFILITGGEFINAQSKKNQENTTRSSYQNTSITFSGTLLNDITKSPIPNAEVYFIH